MISLQVQATENARLINDAGLSVDGRYRYWLTRGWAPGAWVNFICLNPSTADANRDDATTRKLRAFATRWGFGGYWLTNLYAFRATDPADLRGQGPLVDIVGRSNDEWIRDVARRAGLIVAAWGAHADAARERRVHWLLDTYGFPGSVKCLGLTKDGHPRHPLYLRGDTVMSDFSLSAKATDKGTTQEDARD